LDPAIADLAGRVREDETIAAARPVLQGIEGLAWAIDSRSRRRSRATVRVLVRLTGGVISLRAVMKRRREMKPAFGGRSGR
jgi:hypothetical protein